MEGEYGRKTKKKFNGFDDTNIKEEQERLINRDKKYKIKHDVKDNENLWEYIKRKENEENIQNK